MSPQEWIPLSQRQQPNQGFEGPFEGVPSWLVDSLMAWLTPHFVYPSNRGVTSYQTEALRQLERRIRREIPGDSGYRKWTSLAIALPQDEELFLDVLDFQLHRMDEEYYIGDEDESAERLEELLAQGGSAWTVVARGGVYGLERRVPAAMMAAASNATAPSDNAATHLQAAWTKVYGREPDPSGAYRESVKAVEASAKAVLLPNDDWATLGKMISRVEQAPAKFAVSLTPSDFTATDGVVGMMKLLWKGQRDRHGTDDPAAPLQISQDEAEAALWLAITLVQWFRNGAIKEV